ncbi:MAG: rRNA methyltransferase [Thermaerobacter sp.]|nr:rRNA methyltransferase [Thermaerobacter sp.]
MQLPQDLRAALESELSSLPAKRLSTAAMELSHRYREASPAKGAPLVRSREDVAAYAAVRLPATFAAVYAALRQAKGRLPSLEPRTLLDAGAGPGTAMWAAAALWPSLAEVTLLERDADMIHVGRRLAAHSRSAALQQAEWVPTNLAKAWETKAHDLVTAAYVLGELPQGSQEMLVHTLWEKTQSLLVLVEPGTPAGFSRIRTARDQLLAAGAKTIAPCPHDAACPLSGTDWCHFAQRVERSSLHRLVKAGVLSYEDEKFSFVAVSRLDPVPIHGRVIRHPQVRGGHVRLEVCAPQGLQSTVITRKDRDLFRKARDLIWGSAMVCENDDELK